MSRDQRRRLLRQLRDSGFTVKGNDGPVSLALGPPPRFYYRPDWPEMETQALAAWNRSREAIMGEWPDGPRPWAYFWFDRPHADTIPGPQRDALLAAGRLTAQEADFMASSHTVAAWAAIAASRPGQATADWLADPALIEKTIALVGWNPFTEEAIAHLRETYTGPGAVRRSPVHPTEEETAE